jgi:hypothetical protein
MANLNPLVAQGTLNRLRGSVIWNTFPQLNVTASFLGPEAIRLALEGESVPYLPTLTGAVTSPEPYMMINMVINLLKSQSLSDAYKQQMESNSLLGSCTVRPDATTLSPYALNNCSIKSVRELSFAGTDAIYAVTIGGYYLVNQSLFNL